MSDRPRESAVNVLVVEDEPKTAELVRLYLERDGHSATVAHDGRVALELFDTLRPDLVVLDIMLPGVDGIQVCRAIRNRSTVPILILTARTSEADTIAGLDSGADDYVIKPFSPRELSARIRALLRRTPHPADGPGSTIQVKDLVVDTYRRTVTVAGREVRLTRIEFDILAAMIRQPGRVFTRSQLVEAAFGDDYEGFDRSVDAHMLRLRRKIEPDRNTPLYLLTVYGVGYRFAEAGA